MYYIVGVVAESDLVWLGSAPAKTFEHIFQRLSPSCWFVHCFSKTFQDRLRFCIRKNKTVKSLAADEDQSFQFESIVEIEEVEKRQKQKLFARDEPHRVLFGFYCGQSEFLSDCKELKAMIN